MLTDIDMKQIAIQQRIPLNEVFMKDKPPMKVRPGGYVINMQDSKDSYGEAQNGTHWVALWIPRYTNQKIIYCDSFGFIIPQSLINWIRRRGGLYKNCQIVCNDKDIQDVNTGGCGVYSLFFIQFVSRYNPISNPVEILKEYDKLWSKDTKKNLQLLKKYAPYYQDSV